MASNDPRTKIEEVRCVAAVAQVRTMADGGLRFVFDTDEQQVLIAAWLMDVKAKEGAVEIVMRRG